MTTMLSKIFSKSCTTSLCFYVVTLVLIYLKPNEFEIYASTLPIVFTGVSMVSYMLLETKVKGLSKSDYHKLLGNIPTIILSFLLISPIIVTICCLSLTAWMYV